MTVVTLRSSNRTPLALIGTPGTATPRTNKAKRGGELLAQLVADGGHEVVKIRTVFTSGELLQALTQANNLFLEVNRDVDLL